MAHPVQDVQIHGITQRAPSAKHKKRWRVRWMVDGRAHDKVFATSNEANRYLMDTLGPDGAVVESD